LNCNSVIQLACQMICQNTQTPFMWLALNLRNADWGTQAHDASNLCKPCSAISENLFLMFSVTRQYLLMGRIFAAKKKHNLFSFYFFVVGHSCGGLDFPLFSNSTLSIWQNLPFQVLQSNSLIIPRHSKCRPAKCWTLYKSDPNLPISY